MMCSLDCEVNPKCTVCKVKMLHSRNNLDVTFAQQLELYNTIDGSIDRFMEIGKGKVR